MKNLLAKELRKKSNKEKAALLQRFFKTGKGQYGEGDIFLGVVVPDIRQVVKKYRKIVSLKDAQKLLHSKYHEERLCALLILIEKFKKGDDKVRKDVFGAYLKNTEYVNSWDLVDLSAPKIVGEYLYKKPRKVLYKLIKSKILWERRIAVLATAYFIGKNDFSDILKIANLLLLDEHDLMHKAVGWMLREIGKRDQAALEKFLNQNYKNMPRTMLRYAIEKLPERKRRKYLRN